jgi:CRP/FNR family transcriptional regulator, nitrogen oxide reductase regulator
MQALPAAAKLSVSRAARSVSRAITAVSECVDLVRHFVLFADLSSAECTNILATAREKRFSRRERVFVEGDPVQHIVLLTSGCVKETQFSQNGNQVILRLNAPGELVGPVGNSREGHDSTAEALQESRALLWDVASFEDVAERFPTVRRNTARILGKRLEELEERFREVATEKVASRVSSQIVRLLNQMGKQASGELEIGLSREELAQLTGTTLFTVSRLLSRWEHQGIVTARREAVLVRNLPALIVVSEHE